MLCTFYTICKRTNSTARPVDGQQYNIELKDNCSMIAPVIKMAFGNSNPTTFNYCYLPDFNRYYFIRDWSFDRSLWLATLSEDVLATWRDQIGNSTQYILRSSYTFDGTIADSRYPASAVVQTLQNSFQGQFSETIGDGFFVFGFISKNPNSIGAITYVVMSPTNAKRLSSLLLTNVSYLSIDNTEISDNLTKVLFNPYQYIVSCNYFPFPIASVTAHLPLVQTIDVGWWSIDISGWIIGSDNNYLEVTATATIPKHPQAAQRGEFCNAEPYSKYSIYYQPYGVIPIESGKIWGAQSLTLTNTVDLFTGFAVLRIKTDSGKIVTERTVSLAVSIPLANISVNLPTAGIVQTGAAALFSGIQSLVSGKDIASAASGILDAVQATNADVESKGAAGSTIAFDMAPYIVGRFAILVDDNNDDAGRPLCRRMAVHDIPGFLMIYDPDVSLPATQAEIDAVKTFMQDGFFWE